MGKAHVHVSFDDLAGPDRRSVASPGEYLVRLDLDMLGEWDLKLLLSGPMRDQLVLHCQFDERGGRVVRRPK